jgi:hypothetical protein
MGRVGETYALMGALRSRKSLMPKTGCKRWFASAPESLEWDSHSRKYFCRTLEVALDLLGAQSLRTSIIGQHDICRRGGEVKISGSDGIQQMLGSRGAEITGGEARIQRTPADPVEEGKAVKTFLATRLAWAEPGQERVVVSDGREVAEARLCAVQITDEQQQGVVG